MPSKEKLREREEFLEKFNHRFKQKCDKVSDILQKLDWSSQHFVNLQRTSVCPFDSGHTVPEDRLDAHLSACALRQKGCSKEEIKDIITSPDFVSPHPNSIKVDEMSLNNILWSHHVKTNSVYYGHKTLPATRDRANSELGCSERAAVYDHVIQKAKKNNQLIPTVADEFLTRDLPKELKRALKDMDKPKSEIEVLAAQRDYKRRRQSYKGKSVHTSKKSYTEIIREVINNQVDDMRESWKNENPDVAYVDD